MMLADELGVEAPFVTTMNNKLLKLSFVQHVPDPEDNRAKLARITEKGSAFVDEIEVHLRKEMKLLFKDISVKDILAYLHVLQGIINNAKKV